MIYWSGIPCAHIIKAVLAYGGSIEYYINSRWVKKGSENHLEKEGLK